LDRLNQAREELATEFASKQSALSQYADLDARIQSSGRELESTERLFVSAGRERDGLIARLAQIEQRRQQIEAANTRLAQVEEEFGAARTEQEDYNYLARVFGPDEIQLCEIQAAGPQVSTLVNALLEGCFDNKLEIRFRTQRPKADGKGMVDDFDVEVRNKNLDRTCLVDELSGGQFVLVNEAVNLGIAIYNMRQGEGIRYETLFRDETVGVVSIPRLCRGILTRSGLATVLGFVLYGSLIVLPLFMQTLLGWTATAGIWTSPRGIANAMCLPVVGYLLGKCWDGRWMLAVGFVVASLDFSVTPRCASNPAPGTSCCTRLTREWANRSSSFP
jgi:DNA-binding Lrp family transcriptional regulator